MSRFESTFARVATMLERQLGQSVIYTDCKGASTTYANGIVDFNELLGDTRTDRGRTQLRMAMLQIMADGTKGPSTVEIGDTFEISGDKWEVKQAPDKSGGMWAIIVSRTVVKERSGRGYREENG